jgi:hypothetical protein
MAFAMQSQQPLQAATHADSGEVAPASASAGSSSISQLVQALQQGAISKQQLYSSLTNMYKGQTPLGKFKWTAEEE